ncbi:MAG: M48 family metalloprotease [Candidatus Heimdallarchaeota archaeon]|nr:MAG: M48 family metalloprotease [Candidatus Heimdallarchaeota archaeon]
MILQYELQNILSEIPFVQLLSAGVSILLALIFLLELRKYLKYRSFPDLMELSGIGLMVTTLFTLTGDILLAGLAGILALMIIGSFEVRENPIWFRMMITFTISYGFFFAMVLLGYMAGQAFPSMGDIIKEFLISIGFNSNIEIQQFFVGIGYNLVLWIMVLTAFIVFGKKFIVVTRFISPQMIYLVLYLIALLLILQLRLPENLDWVKYLAIFLVNFLIYLGSGPLLSFLFGIKPLEDDRVDEIIKEVQIKINTPIRKIGIVKAPILNAFAYGPWFDQRIAYIASDLNQFTDSEIRGITAHELVHAKKKHTLWLLVLTAIEIIIKYLIDAPIGGYWEFVLGTNQTWDFLSFWIFNIILFAILLTFVKIMEGQADKITREMGFGIDLAESLYRLEGFYYGIAGEIGFNAQLMTGKERSKDENIRFMGDQAFYLYRNLAPSRMTCFMNLIAAHPLTSIRLALQLDQSIGAIRAGFMIWFLLIPGIRKRTIRKLQKNHQEIADLLSRKYSRDFGTINDYLEITFEENWADYYVGRHILAKPWLSEGVAYWGCVKAFHRTKNIVSPIELEIETSDGSQIKIPKCDYSIVLAEPQHKYFTKKGSLVVLDQVEIAKGKFRKFHFTRNGNRISSRSVGLDISEFQRRDYWLVYKEGIIQSWNLKEVQITENFKDSTFMFEDETKNEKHFFGRELVISSPPLVQMIYSKNWHKEREFFKLLQRLDEPFILYDKEDIDIGAPCKVKALLNNDETIEFLEGRTTRSLIPKDLDAVVLDYPFFIINFRKEMGFGNILTLKLFNRGLKTKYIGLNS